MLKLSKSLILRLKTVSSWFSFGPSGCGKSTTLRGVLLALKALLPDIVVGGKLMNKVDAKDRDFSNVHIQKSYASPTHDCVMRTSLSLPKTKGHAESRNRCRSVKSREMLELDPLLNRKPKSFLVVSVNVAMGRAMVRT